MVTRPAYAVLDGALRDARTYCNPYLTPEHVLFQMETEGIFSASLEKRALGQSYFRDRLGLFLSSLTSWTGTDEAVRMSDSLETALDDAVLAAGDREDIPIDIPHLLFGIAGIKDSLAGYLLRKNPEVLEDFGVILFDSYQWLDKT